MTSLFISYSRKDTDCAHKLTDAFKSQEFDFWIDWEGIPPTVDWWNEVERGIEQAGVFLFLVSPNSIQSKVCRREIDHALKNGKRLIPVVICDVNAAEAPTVLSHLNWIFIRESDDFDTGFNKLITAIKTDYDWVRVHRELQTKALEWERGKRDKSFLLRGTELDDAESQLRTNAAKEPHPTELQREYMSASRKDTYRQRRNTAVLASLAIIALAVLAVWGWGKADLATIARAEALAQKGTAEANAATAETAKKNALAQKGTAQANAAAADIAKKDALKAQADTASALKRSEYQRLAAEANVILGDPNGNTETAALLSVRALKGGYIPVANAALDESLNHLYTRTILDQHDEVVRTVAYSPKGDRVLIGYQDGTADLYDSSSFDLSPSKCGKHFEALGPSQGPDQNTEYSGILAADFSTSGRYLLVASSGGLIHICDQKTDSESEIDLENYSGVNWELLWSAKFSPDENFILVGTGYPYDGKGNIYLFKRETGELKLTFPQIHTRFINDVEFSRDGKLILSTSFDRTAILWDMDWSQFIVSPRQKIELSEPIRDGALSKDGRLILLGSDNGAAALYKTDGSLIKEFDGHTSSVYSVAFHPSGSHILTASWDHTARLWDINTGQAIRTFANHSDIIWSAVLSPNGKYLLTGSHDKTARLSIADPIYETRSIHDYSGSISFLPGGDRILSSGSDGTVRVWDVDTLERKQLENIGALKTTFTAVSAQGQWIAARSSNQTITLWKKTGGIYEEAGIIPMEDQVTTFTFSPSIDRKESKYLLVGMASGACSAQLITIDETANRITYPAYCWINSVRFTPDGQYVAIGAVGELPIYTIDGTREAYCDQGPGSLTFSRDGKYLAATTGNDIVLWEWRNDNDCTLLKKLTGHKAEVTSIDFSPDGRFLLSASGDGTAKLWETNTWTVARTLIGHKGAVLAVAFSPDGNLVVTGGADHTIRFWDMDFQTTIQRACSILSMLPRDFYPEELSYYEIKEDLLPTCNKAISETWNTNSN